MRANVLKQLAGAAVAAAVLSAGTAGAQEPDTAYIPVVVNVNAAVSIQPPAGTEGAAGATRNMTADTPDTLAVALGSSVSVSHRTQARPNAPATVSHSRGSVSLKLHPQQYGNAAVSLYTVNGKRVLSGRADASKASQNISRSNIAAGIYLLRVKGIAGNSYAARLTHSGGKLNINVAFTGESAMSPPMPAKANAASDAWTITVTAQAEGYGDTSYSFTPVKGMNPVQNITLRIPAFAVDISQETDEWKYMVVGGDGSSMFIDVDESNDMPTRVFLRPDKNSDEGFTMFFKENGLPDKMVVDGHILYFGNFNGYKYDMAIIYPDDRIEYHFDIVSDVNWDDYFGEFGLAKARYFSGLNKTLTVLKHTIGIGTCATTIVTAITAPPVAAVTLKMCASYVIGEVIDGLIDLIPNKTITEALHLVNDARSCAMFYFGGAWENWVNMLSGVGDAHSCVSMATGIFSRLSNQNSNLTAEKSSQVDEAKRQMKEREEERKTPAQLIADYFNDHYATRNHVTASANGDTVIVTGSAGLTSATTVYTLSIDAGVTVIWRATVELYPTRDNISLININGGSGTFRMESGKLQAYGLSEGLAIYNNSAVTVNIAGGTVSLSNIENASAGALNISGGTVSGTVYNKESGAVTVSGGTIGNINNSAGAVAITGGTIEGNINNFYGAVAISGGTIEGNINNFYDIFGEEPDPAVNLGGDPVINGRIYDGKVSALASFAPAGSKVYTLDFPAAGYADNNIAVANGGNFLDNFTLYNSSWVLERSGANLVMTRR